MTNNLEILAYKNWFNSSFTNEERSLLSSIGVDCKAEHIYFKHEILDIYGDITNHELKKHPDLYERFIDRYIELMPKPLRSQIDRDLLKEDKYYAAWFFNRHCFFEKYQELQAGQYLLWSPIIDVNTPDECKEYDAKLFNGDDKFLTIAESHWKIPQSGCRCSLMILRERQIKRGIDAGQFDFYKK